MGRFLRAQDEQDMKIGGEKKLGDKRLKMLKKVDVVPLSPFIHKIFLPLANDYHKLGHSIRFAQRQKMKSFVEAQREQIPLGLKMSRA